MRHCPNLHAEKFRVDGPPNTNFGLFAIPSPVKGSKWKLKVMVSVGSAWDHVSVSLPDRCPNWEEMDYVKHIFFRDDEWCMQVHPADTKKVNVCETALHLWRPQTQEEVDEVIADWRKSGEALPPEYENLHAPGPIPIPPTILV